MKKIIQVCYIILFILALMVPHLIRGHVMNLSEEYAQSIATLLLLITAGTIYVLSKMLFKRQENQKQQIKKELNHSVDELNDAFRYIGRANRQLPLFQDVTTNLFTKRHEMRKDKTKILEDLLATIICSVAKSSAGMIVCVNKNSSEIIRKVVYPDKKLFEIGSMGDILNILSKNSPKKFPLVVGNFLVFSTSDHRANVRVVLVLPNTKDIEKAMHSSIQAMVDQMQLLNCYLFPVTAKRNNYVAV